MRIISQDGTLDIPYEQVVIQRFNGEIYFLNKNLIGVEQLCGDKTQEGIGGVYTFPQDDEVNA